MVDYGFKRLTRDNWHERDPTHDVYFRFTDDMGIRSVSADDWLTGILAPQLAPNVPDEVHRLYEVARGALAYGYCFYPLYALGIEQVSRVAETAIDHKCKAMGVPSKRNTLAKRIDWLIEQGTLTAADGEVWHGFRHFRNEASHPERQQIIPPVWASEMLRSITERINSLFP